MSRCRALFACLVSFGCLTTLVAADLPDAAKLKPIKLFEVDHYCEGVVFDHQGRGYVSEGEQIVQFTLDGKHKTWAKTGSESERSQDSGERRAPGVRRQSTRRVAD